MLVKGGTRTCDNDIGYVIRSWHKLSGWLDTSAECSSFILSTVATRIIKVNLNKLWIWRSAKSLSRKIATRQERIVLSKQLEEKSCRVYQTKYVPCFVTLTSSLRDDMTMIYPTSSGLVRFHWGIGRLRHNKCKHNKIQTVAIIQHC